MNHTEKLTRQPPGSKFWNILSGRGYMSDNKKTPAEVMGEIARKFSRFSPGFQAGMRMQQDFARGESGDSPLELPQQPPPKAAPPRDCAKKTCLDRITFAAWQVAVSEYEKIPGRRKKDALRKRVDIFLRLAEGEPFTSVQESYPKSNISALRKEAEERDIPKLRELYPNLPPLE